MTPWIPNIGYKDAVSQPSGVNGPMDCSRRNEVVRKLVSKSDFAVCGFPTAKCGPTMCQFDDGGGWFLHETAADGSPIRRSICHRVQGSVA